MADYDVEFSYSTLDRPWIFNSHVAMRKILRAPDDLTAHALRNYIEAELLRSIEGIAHIEGLKIRKP